MPRQKYTFRKFRNKNWLYPPDRLGEEIDRILDESATQPWKASKAIFTRYYRRCEQLGKARNKDFLYKNKLNYM